jgi:hypothetical protein
MLFQSRRFLEIEQSEGDSFFCLADFLNSSLKPFGQMNRNLVGSIDGRSSINSSHFVRFREEFKKSANQKKESPVVAMFVNGSRRNEQS